MKNGVWVCGFVLSLGGWSPCLFGQESTWHPVPPAAVAASDVQLQPCPAASLGRPVLLRARSAAPDASSAIHTASFLDSAAVPQSAVDPSAWTNDEDQNDRGSDFAIDRAVPIAAEFNTAGVYQVGLSGGIQPTGAEPPKLLAGIGDAPPASGMAPAEDLRYPKWYLTGEYLLWWLKQDKVPVLATASSNPFDNGILGKPTTQVLFGGDGLDGSARSGFRITGGWWLDETCKDDAIEVSGFYLAPRRTNFDANSSQFPTLARPFFNENQGIEFSQLTAFPGVETGDLSVNNQSKLFGAEINGRCNICCGCNYRFDLLGGFRFLELEELLTITENGLFLAGEGPPLAGDTFFVRDFFGTRNQFYGGQVGILGEYDWGRFSIEGWAKIALGDTHQDILIDGNQSITSPDGTVQRFRGGLLALPSNIGRFSQDRFGVIPELNVNLGYQLTDHVRLFVGYDVLYWNRVVRPGTQIDRVIDITQIPNFPVPGVMPVGQNRPSAPRDGTDFWAQGATFGVEVRY